MNSNSLPSKTFWLKPLFPTWVYFAVGLGLLVGAAVLDVNRPFDRSWSILYILVTLYAGWFLRGRAELVLHGTVILSVFLVPMLFRMEMIWPGTGLFYRTTGVMAGMVLIAFMWDRRRFIVALQHANNELERKVITRTSELQTTNESLRHEIAEREKSETSLRVSEQRFALFMQNLPGLAWIKDTQGRYVYANDAAVKIYRLSRDQLYGKTDDEVFPQEVAALFAGGDQRVRASKMAVQMVESLELEDGILHHAIVSKFPLPVPDGSAFLVGGMAMDITERQQAENTIRKISAFREAIIRTAAEGICVCYALPEDPYVGFSVWNEQMTEITGYTMDEINRLGWYQSLYPDPDVRESAQKRMARMREGDDMRSEEWEVTRKDGKRRTLAISTSGVEIEEGLNGAVALIQDITERKEAELALHESEARFRLLFEGANDAIFWADAETGLLTHCNLAAEALLGRERAEIIGQPQSFLHPPEESNRYRELFRAHVTSGLKTSVEAEVLRKDGQRVVVSIAPSVTMIGTQKVIQGIFRDITQRKRIEESLQMMRFSVDHAGDSVFWISREGHILYTNDAACLDRGYSHEEMLAMTIFDLDVEPDYQPGRWEQHFDELKHRGTITLETRHRAKDGRVFPIEVNANYVQIGDKEFNFASVRDITERKRVDEELRLSRQRLENLSRQLISTQEAERRHLARELHDQIGQVLTAIKMNLRHTQRVADANLQSHLDENVAMVDLAIVQVRNLSLSLRPPQLDELGLVAALHWLVKHQARLGGFENRMDVDLDNLQIPAEMESVCFRIAQEALTNAVRHGGAHNIHVKLWASDDELLLSIHDDGIGFDVDDGRLRAMNGGSIGLISMQERANLVGGHFEIESTPGQGTTIRLCLPLSQP